MGMMGRDKTKKDTYMCATLLNMFSRRELRKNHPQQRKADKWKSDARDGFIATAIKHEDVDSIKICEQLVDGKVILWLIDGLQRLTVLEKYKKGIFKLGKNVELPIVYYQRPGKTIDEYGAPVMEDVEFDLREKGYADLPMELKEKFDNYQIDVVKHLDCTDEEIGYHIRRYNRQTSMNHNENSITYMDAIAKNVKEISQSHCFFKDCGSFSATELNNGTCERVVCESLMAMFHLENWQKNSKKLGTYLNRNASDREFQTLRQELDRLEAAAVKQSGAFFRQMMSPVLELVEHCDSLEGLQEQLKDEEALRQLYNAMKVKDFDQLVEQVMYVSNMLGRMQDG